MNCIEPDNREDCQAFFMTIYQHKPTIATNLHGEASLHFVIASSLHVCASRRDAVSITPGFSLGPTDIQRIAPCKWRCKGVVAFRKEIFLLNLRQQQDSLTKKNERNDG